MRLWHLFRPDCEVGVDEADGFVVLAKGPRAARQLAADQHGDEGAIWLDPSRCRCVQVDMTGPARVILRSFNAG